jgi:phage shock protein PspC (stress-responsive transcriptional regulator)
MNHFHKSNKNRVFFGVCGGLAESLGLDVSVVRLGFVVGAIFTGSILFWAYLLMALILPTED